MIQFPHLLIVGLRKINMDNQRTFLFIALALVMMMLWQAWQKDYGPQLPPPQTTQLDDTQIPSVTNDSLAQDLPSTDSLSSVPTNIAQVQPSAKSIQVITDVFELEIDTRGGTIRKIDLLDYPISVSKPDEPFTLFADSVENLFIAQSGLVPVGTQGSAAPDHHAIYQAGSQRYQLTIGKDTLEVPLTWETDGIVVTKTFLFQRGQYDIQIKHEVNNQSPDTWVGRQYQQFQRSRAEREQAFIYTYTGGVIYGQEQKYEKIDFDDMDSANLRKSIAGGWTAMIQHYFLGAWVAKEQETNEFYTKVLRNGPPRYILGMINVQPVQVEPGGQTIFSSTLYAGPKIQEHLKTLGPGLELTVDYGILTIIAQPLFWLLSKLHQLFGNWGWSIVFVTLIIKLLFYKLSETSYKSMANMRKMTPRLQSIKERYGDDRQKLNKAMMDLYKKEKINPLGGCLPILVQIPVFIALYWVLLESVELRQAPFILWIQDLSIKDPYFVLPVVMGVTMFLQQKLNPAPIDPIQQKVMMFLPFVFTIFFAFFPAGLVLYWVVNNVLSIAQQWMITRKIEKGTVATT